jgi:hypothetical protein
VKKKQRLWKKIFLDCRNLQVFINFPTMANPDDGDHDFPGILMEYHAVAAHSQPEIIIFSLQKLQVPVGKSLSVLDC